MFVDSNCFSLKSKNLNNLVGKTGYFEFSKNSLRETVEKHQSWMHGKLTKVSKEGFVMDKSFTFPFFYLDN